MGNLTAFQPETTPTVAAIYDWWKKRGDSEPQRGYLGASIIGHDCDRFLWFTFRGLVNRNFDGRMYRLFNSGHLAEPRFVQELQGIGCEVHDVDENGKQFEVKAVAGHFSGHMDGVALGIPEAPKSWHVCEFKTHSAKSFSHLQNNGVQKSKPTHYAQMMVYMGLSKLDRALYLAVNKDTDELYSERIRFSASEFKAIMARAERIIKSVNPCERCTTRQDDFRCKMCDASDICWGGAVAFPVKYETCRSCCHATPEMNGDARWSCAKYGVLQEGTCEDHLILPTLLLGCEPIDGGDGFIEFKNADGKTWKHGKGFITTKDLMKLPIAVLPATLQAKGVLKADVAGFEVPKLSLIDRYSHKDNRLLWEGVPDSEELEEFLADLLIADSGALPEPTEEEKTDTTMAFEYAGKYCLVVYKADKYAAVWEGME